MPTYRRSCVTQPAHVGRSPVPLLIARFVALVLSRRFPIAARVRPTAVGVTAVRDGARLFPWPARRCTAVAVVWGCAPNAAGGDTIDPELPRAAPLPMAVGTGSLGGAGVSKVVTGRRAADESPLRLAGWYIAAVSRWRGWRFSPLARWCVHHGCQVVAVSDAASTGLGWDMVVVGIARSRRDSR